MPPDREHNGSSIPIPDDLIVYYTSPLTMNGEQRVVLEVDLPKLYAHWAEDAASKIEMRLRSTFGLQDWHEDEVAELVIGLRAALGLGERT